jgi:hypothetical protein
MESNKSLSSPRRREPSTPQHCRGYSIPAFELVKESPHPLIPAEAGIQSLRKMPSELGPRFRGDERVETPHVPSAVFFTGSFAGYGRRVMKEMRRGGA